MTARDRAVLMFVLVLAALGGGWLLVVAPKRAAAAKLGSSVQAVQQQLATLQAQVVAGQRARASFSADYVELAQLGEAVPQNDNVPSLLVELQSAARASGIDFRGLQVTAGGSSGPSPGPAAGASAGTAGTAGASAGTTGTAAASAGPAGASPATAGASAGTAGTAGASAAAVQLPPGVSGGSTGFGAEQFTFTFSGRFFDLSGFLGRVEDFVVANGPLVRVSGRLMTLNAISLGPAPQGFPQMLASVSATTYLLPASQGLFDGATAAGPATATGSVPAAGTGLAGASSGPAGTTSAPGGTNSGPAGTTSAPAGNSSAPAAPSSTAGGASTGAGAAPAPSAAISAQSALAGGSR